MGCARKVAATSLRLLAAYICTSALAGCARGVAATSLRLLTAYICARWAKIPCCGLGKR